MATKVTSLDEVTGRYVLNGLCLRSIIHSLKSGHFSSELLIQTFLFHGVFRFPNKSTLSIRAFSFLLRLSAVPHIKDGSMHILYNWTVWVCAVCVSVKSRPFPLQPKSHLLWCFFFFFCRVLCIDNISMIALKLYKASRSAAAGWTDDRPTGGSITSVEEKGNPMKPVTEAEGSIWSLFNVCVSVC